MLSGLLLFDLLREKRVRGAWQLRSMLDETNERKGERVGQFDKQRHCSMRGHLSSPTKSDTYLLVLATRKASESSFFGLSLAGGQTVNADWFGVVCLMGFYSI